MYVLSIKFVLCSYNQLNVDSGKSGYKNVYLCIAGIVQFVSATTKRTVVHWVVV